MVVREIFESFLAGQSIGEIRRWLNDSGIKGYFGGEWNRARVYDTLCNEKYVGDILYQKRFVNNHLEKKIVVNRGQLPKYYVSETHVGIIDRSTFNRVQEILKSNSEKYGKFNRETTNSVFSHKLICGHCGSRMKRSKRKDRTIWVCPIYFEKGKRYCPLKAVRNDILENATTEIAESFDLNMADFFDRVQSITVYESRFVFNLLDGTQLEKEWHNKSRSESWTPEMKEMARQRRYKQGEMKCRK